MSVHYDIAAIEAELRRALGKPVAQDHPDPVMRAQGRAGEICIQHALWVMRERNNGLDLEQLYMAAAAVMTAFVMNLTSGYEGPDREEVSEYILDLIGRGVRQDGVRHIVGAAATFAPTEGGNA